MWAVWWKALMSLPLFLTCLFHGRIFRHVTITCSRHPTLLISWALGTWPSPGDPVALCYHLAACGSRSSWSQRWCWSLFFFPLEFLRWGDISISGGWKWVTYTRNRGSVVLPSTVIFKPLWPVWFPFSFSAPCNGNFLHLKEAKPYCNTVWLSGGSFL